MKKFSGRIAIIGDKILIKPPMKGGHRHNHIYNVCNRILFRSKGGRKISAEAKREWREIFELQVFCRMHPIGRARLLDILKKEKKIKEAN